MKEKSERRPLIRDYALYRCPVTGSRLEERGDELVAVEGGRRYALHDGIPDFATATVAGTSKHQIQDFWDTEPCGSKHPDSKGVEPGSPVFCADTENRRYELHRDFAKPFLKEAVRFDQIAHQRVLEVGCGIGVDAIQFARRANDMYLVDLSAMSLRLTLRRFANEQLAAHAALADAENLPFEAGSFDVAYSFGVLHHSPNTERSIEQLHRILKPGGTAIVMLYAKYSAMTLFQTGLHYGLREGQLLKLGSWQRVLSEWTDMHSGMDGVKNPLTRVFSLAECRKMFAQFAAVETAKHYLRESHFAEARHILKVLPARVRERLPRLLGWNIIIRATR